jgi:predicted nucleotidyltransferase
MRIERDQEIAGFPARAIRGLFRKIGMFQSSADLAAHELSISLEEATLLMERLQSEGFLQACNPHYDGVSRFELTSKGLALAGASAAKPVSRKTAERVLQEFMDRVGRINESASYLYTIDSVVLFGSFLSPASHLNDVDVAIRLVPRIDDPGEFQVAYRLRNEQAQRSGRKFRSFFDHVAWPTEEIFLFLKSRSRTLSIHGMEDLSQLDGVQYRVLIGDQERLRGIIPNGKMVC